MHGEGVPSGVLWALHGYVLVEQMDESQSSII